MSFLADHARAARVLAQAFAEQALDETPLERRMTLRAIGAAYLAAAATLDAEVRAGAELMAAGHRCTVDHSTLPKGVARCGACGAPRP